MAIDRNCKNSLFPPLPNPSAIFDGIDTAALLNWSLNPKSLAKLTWLEAFYISTVKLLAFCQTNISSILSILLIFIVFST